MDTVCMGCFGQLNNPGGRCPVCGYNETLEITQPHHLRPRSILNGKYLLGKVLGQGGFGITYIGWDLNLDMKVAIKEYYPSGFVSRETTSTSTVQPFTGSQGDFFSTGKNRFINEAKSLARFFSLPGIVSVKDYFQENGTAYIAMEYIDGQTLKDYLGKMGGKLQANQVLELMKPVMSSLAEVHKGGIIHRDISPDNIMISKEGHMKLLDFGAAREFAGSGNKSMSIMLKPGFAPEEQYRTKGVQGPWTDVYALSATMYKCITGITPDESLDRIAEDSVKPLRALGAAITAGQEAAIMKGMAVKQNDRFQSVTEMYAALYGPQTSIPTTVPISILSSDMPVSTAPPVNANIPKTIAPRDIPATVYAPPSAPLSEGTNINPFMEIVKKYKWAYVAITCVTLLAILFVLSPWSLDNKNTAAKQFDTNDYGAFFVKYLDYRDIPGVTEQEIQAIEELKTIRPFSFGVLLDSNYNFTNEAGVLIGSSALFCEWLTELFGIPFLPELLEWNDLTDGLVSGRVDFTGELTATAERKNVYHMSDNLPISLSTGNPMFMPIISVMQKAMENGSDDDIALFYRVGHNKYLANELLTQLTDEERAYLDNYIYSNGTVRVPYVIADNNPPFSYYYPRNKQWGGTVFDTLTDITAITGLLFEIVNKPNTDFPDLLNMLENGEASMITNLPFTAEREGRFLWAVSPPYYSDNLSFGFNIHEANLCAIINKALKVLSDNRSAGYGIWQIRTDYHAD